MAFGAINGREASVVLKKVCSKLNWVRHKCLCFMSLLSRQAAHDQPLATHPQEQRHKQGKKRTIDIPPPPAPSTCLFKVSGEKRVCVRVCVCACVRVCVCVCTGG